MNTKVQPTPNYTEQIIKRNKHYFTDMNGKYRYIYFEIFGFDITIILKSLNK